MAKKTDLTSNFHNEYLDGLKYLKSPSHLGARVLVRKLKSQGVDAENYIDIIEKALNDALSKDQNILELPINFNNPDIQDVVISLDIDEEIYEEVTTELIKAVEDNAVKIIDECRKSCLGSILDEPDERLLHYSIEIESFCKRLNHKWREPFKLLEIQILVSTEISQAWSQKLKKSRAKNKDLVEVLFRLNARAIQISREILVLLKNGFADGAQARWRTLHEISVVCNFLLREGNEAALMYLEHMNVDSYKSALQYQKYAAELGYKPIPESEIESLKMDHDSLISKHGKEFAKDYGWAAKFLNGRSANFAEIEISNGQDRYRPFVRFASGNVHAGSKAAFHRLGLGNLDGYLYGPSNVGLDEAAKHTAISIAQIASCIMNIKPNTDSAIWTGVLLDLSRKIEAEAIKVQNDLLDE